MKGLPDRPEAPDAKQRSLKKLLILHNVSG